MKMTLIFRRRRRYWFLKVEAKGIKPRWRRVNIFTVYWWLMKLLFPRVLGNIANLPKAVNVMSIPLTGDQTLVIHLGN